MNYSKGYAVNLIKKHIVLTKDFARKVSDITSTEYTTFMQVRAAYPTFAVVKYTINQKKEREKVFRLSYKDMETLITEWEKGNKKALEEFESKKCQAKCCSGSYGIVKKWFLGKYGKQYENLCKTGNAN